MSAPGGANGGGADPLLRSIRAIAAIVFIGLSAVVVLVNVAGPFVREDFRLDNVFIFTVFLTLLVLLGIESAIRLINRGQE